jgi:MarR family transcriptional regulator, transcriptional regulator for hemolysin
MPHPSDFDQSLGFLLADVSRLLRRDFDRRVRELALTQAQWRAIAHLSREEGIKQAVLAERLEVQPITLGRLVDRMEAAGWVKRTPDPDDRRASLLYLTAKAQPILAEMRAHANEALDDVMRGVSATARKQLTKALLQMKQNLLTETTTEPRSTGRTTTDVDRKAQTKR